MLPASTPPSRLFKQHVTTIAPSSFPVDLIKPRSKIFDIQRAELEFTTKYDDPKAEFKCTLAHALRRARAREGCHFISTPFVCLWLASAGVNDFNVDAIFQNLKALLLLLL